MRTEFLVRLSNPKIHGTLNFQEIAAALLLMTLLTEFALELTIKVDVEKASDQLRWFAVQLLARQLPASKVNDAVEKFGVRMFTLHDDLPIVINLIRDAVAEIQQHIEALLTDAETRANTPYEHPLGSAGC